MAPPPFGPIVTLFQGAASLPLESHDANRYMARMARIYQTRAWQDQLSPSIDEMELLALEAYAHAAERPSRFTDNRGSKCSHSRIQDRCGNRCPFCHLLLFSIYG